MENIFNIFRVKYWWSHVIPPILVFVYIFSHLNNLTFYSTLFLFALFMLSIIGTASYGYLLNDISDIKDDNKASKTNYVSKLKNKIRFILLGSTIIIAFIPWIWLPIGLENFSLFVFQIFLLTIYSIKPIRLKKHIYLGILIDALYSNIIFILLVILTINSLSDVLIKNHFLLIAGIFSWGLFKGIRNILLHQIDDYENDIRANNQTYVNKHNLQFAKKTIYITTTIEIFSFFCVLFFISEHFLFIYLLFPLFIISKLFLQSIFKIKYNFTKVFYDFLNNYYEEWMPIIILIYLSFYNQWFLILLSIHLILFDNICKQLIIKLFK